MARTPGISHLMRRHPVLALLGTAAASLLLHQSIDATCSLGGSSAETFAVQLHDDEAASYTLPDSHTHRDYTVRVVVPDIGDTPDVSTSPTGEVVLALSGRDGVNVDSERIARLGECHLVSTEELEGATWLSLRRDRDVDFVHSCVATASLSAPPAASVTLHAIWRTDDPNAAPPVLLLTAD